MVSRRARSRHSSRVAPLTAMRCQPCARDESTGRPVVISSPMPQRPLGEAFQLGRRVHAVLGVVELLRPDHPQPVLEVAERVARAEDVHPRRDLHRPRQALVEVQPRLVPLGDLQRLHPADGEHGDVPFLAGQPVDQLDRRAVRGAVALDLLGEREQVAAVPVAVADRGQRVRRRHAERDRAVEQPFQLVRGGPPAAHAERAQHLVELLDRAGHPLALGVGHALAEQVRRSARRACRRATAGRT